MADDLARANDEARRAWNRNAAFWDERMGEGNDFVEVLVWPAMQRLLALEDGERVLDIACGNGLTSRRLAALGACVVAFDFAEEMIAHARRRADEHAARIEYRTLDATDETALLALGRQEFDAAICSMALFDMARIEPLARALPQLLRPDGRFVFSVLHPCFNNPGTVFLHEQEERGSETVTTYSVKIPVYLHTTVASGRAIRGQPQAQPLFHRPLHALFRPFFDEGFVIDALEEPGFPADHPEGSTPLSWGGRLSEISPVLVARARLSQPASEP
ncbi:MAG: class I SAM-dependent methyltransferase [Planctomycetota bacterium]|jgi:2-polyprenyl-3-methyl-5-hydroxy-6-metoxy-1,4-benzoquinol methylase